MGVSKETFLVGLEYNITDALLLQLDRVETNTRNFGAIKKHILTLQGHLKPYGSFVALSSTNDYVKIKNQASNEESRKVAESIINKWAKKYKVELEKVFGKETFYIIGSGK